MSSCHPASVKSVRIASPSAEPGGKTRVATYAAKRMKRRRSAAAAEKEGIARWMRKTCFGRGTARARGWGRGFWSGLGRGLEVALGEGGLLLHCDRVRHEQAGAQVRRGAPPPDGRGVAPDDVGERGGGEERRAHLPRGEGRGSDSAVAFEVKRRATPRISNGCGVADRPAAGCPPSAGRPARRHGGRRRAAAGGGSRARRAG